MIDNLRLNGTASALDDPTPANGPSQTDLNGTPAAAKGTPGDHDARTGRFLPGNRAAIGRPFARRVARVRGQLLDFLSEDRVRQLVERMYRSALAGHVGAFRALLEFSVGRPLPAESPDDLDAEELAMLINAPTVLDCVRGKGRVSPGLAVRMLSEALAVDDDGYAKAWEKTVAELKGELDALRLQRARLAGHDLTDPDEDDPAPEPPGGPAA
jgi:hypothetical protein